MCGFVAYKDDRNPYSVIRSIGYRGLEDYIGAKHYDGYEFGHIALPFVNLDPKIAIQPIGKIGVPGLFVGEVFNYDSAIFDTDGEYVHYGLHDHGTDFFHEFDGFWTYVTLLDRHLFGITDHLAIKPLYYRTDMEAMASEIDVLKLFGKVTIDETFMSNTMKWGYSPDPRTPYNEIKQVPPGCYVHKGQVHSYWNWDKVEYGDLYQDMKRSVSARLGGQREVSILLSGGLDSSIIYGLLKELGRDVTAIHVDNHEKDFAHLVSSSLVDVTLDEVSDLDAVRIHQSPVDLGSVKPQIAMARKLRELGFYAVLTGDGADELFGGYRRAKEYDSQHSDIFCELPYYHLPKLDRTMMKYTIELRAPFLAPYIVKHALKTPYILRDGEKKVLKETFRNIVPQEIIDRDKHPLKTKEIHDSPTAKRATNDKLFRQLQVG
jgi:asparagine synthase (glutamine-hydrolysing)